MSFKIDIHPSNTLRITYSGNVNKEEINSVRENAKTMVRVNKLKFILVDLRKAILDVNEMELFNIASSQKKVYSTITKTAIIYTSGRHNHEDLLMYAATANSKGFKVRLFVNGSEASKWLKF